MEELTNNNINEPALPSKCPSCNAPYTNEQFCTSCGYPLQGSLQEQKAFELDQVNKRYDTEKHEKRIRTARTTLFILFGLAAIVSMILAFSTGLQRQLGLYDSTSVTIGIVAIIIVAFIYLGTALWSNKNPFAALLIAFIFFLTMQIIPMVLDPAEILRGIIFKVLFFVLLLNGVVSANALKNMRSK